MRCHSLAGMVMIVLTLGAAAGAAEAFEYSVATNGNDRNPGSADRPFASLQQAANVARAGDVVTVRAGLYRQRAVLAGVGRAGAPIVFRAESGAVFQSPDPAAQTEGIAIHTTAAFVQLVGFEVGGGFGQAVLVRDGAHDIEIRDCKLHGNRVGVAVGSASRVVISGCQLYENQRAGLRIGGAANDVTVADSASFNNDDGLGCNGESDGFVIDGRSVRNVSFVRTRAFGNGEDGYDLFGSDLILDQVESHGGCAGMKLRDTATVSNCLVTGARTGIETTALSSETRFTVVNCTLVDDLFPVIFDAPTRPVRSYSAGLFNSIIIAPNRALDYHLLVDLQEGHNIFWRGDLSQALIRILPEQGEFSGRDLNTGRYRQFTGQGVGTLSVDPLLNDPAAGDFTPRDFSAAVDRGDPARAPLLDLNGVSRPQGTAPDIGAIETLGSAANHPPQAAMSVRRDLFGRVNRPTYFDASASFDPDGDAISFQWDFGDGSARSSQAQVAHLYRLRGLYTARLTVSDGRLTSQLATTINVGNAPTPVPTSPTPTPRPPAPSATPTSAPPTATATPTATPLPSNVLLTFVGSSTGVRGRTVSFSLRYRGLFVPAVIRFSLPAGLRFQTATPGVLHASGNDLVWENPTNNMATLKLYALVANDVPPGAALVTRVKLVETESGRVAERSVTTVVP